MAARCRLAARGIDDPDPRAIAGALLEHEFQSVVVTFLTSLFKR